MAHTSSGEERAGFVPIHEFCRKRGISPQTAYRWIREGKIREEDVITVEVTYNRIRVNEGAEVSAK